MKYIYKDIIKDKELVLRIKILTNIIIEFKI